MRHLTALGGLLLATAALAGPPQCPRPPQAPPVREVKTACGDPDCRCGCTITGACSCVKKTAKKAPRKKARAAPAVPVYHYEPPPVTSGTTGYYWQTPSYAPIYRAPAYYQPMNYGYAAPRGGGSFGGGCSS